MQSTKQTKRLWVEQLEPREVLSTYYVAATGSDAAAGTAQAPWKTLQQAANSVRAGDTVIVRAGSYAGFIMGWDSPTAGTANAPITFEADPAAAPGSVVINAANYETHAGIDLEPGCDYITVAGFNIEGGGGIANYPNHGEGIKVCGSHDVVLNNTVTNIGYGFGIIADNANDVLLQGNTISGTGSHGDADYGHGIYLSGTTDGAVITGNVLADNGYIGLHINGDASEGGTGLVTHATITDNLIYGNGQNGINADGLQDSTIANNVIYGYAGYGICLYQSDAGGPSSGNLLVNNTIVSTTSGAGAAVRILDGGVHNTLLNNILLGGGGVTLRISSDSLSGLVCNYNVVSSQFQSDDTGATQTLAQWQAQTGQDTHSLTASAAALFVNATANDYELAATSPALGTGTATDAPATDFAGNARPQGNRYDIGAYEYVGSAAQLTLGPATVPASTVGVAYNQTIAASGGTGTLTAGYAITSGAIPAGLSFAVSGGKLQISGTPTAAGAVTFEVTATDSVGATTSQSYTLTINPAITLGPTTVPASTVGVAYNQTIAAGGGTGTLTAGYTVTSGSIPAGLTFTLSGGQLTIGGTPTAAGSVTFKVTVTDSTGATTTKRYTLTIKRAIALGPNSVPASTVGVAYSKVITAGGGTGTLTASYAVTSGSIPAGLTFTLSGGQLTISGTPTAAGAVTFEVTATDSVGATTSHSYTLTSKRKT